jgi:hypothetical protein
MRVCLSSGRVVLFDADMGRALAWPGVWWFSELLPMFSESLQYKISWKSIQRFSRCYTRTNRRVDVAKLEGPMFATSLANTPEICRNIILPFLATWSLRQIGAPDWSRIPQVTCKSSLHRYWRFCVEAVSRVSMYITVLIFRVKFLLQTKNTYR